MILLGVFGGSEFIIPLIILVIILFGGKKIPELMRGIGKGVSEFNKAKDGIYDEKDKTEKDNSEKEIKK